MQRGEPIRLALLSVVSTLSILLGGELTLRVLHLPRSEPGTSDRERVRFLHLGARLPDWLEPDSELLWRYRPYRHVEERQGVRWSYTTNGLGFRGPEPRTPPARPLVLCAGDSVTNGFGVEDVDSYPEVLAALLRTEPGWGQSQVLNVGISGYSSEQGLALLGQLVPTLEPTVVVVSFGINDGWLTAFPDRAVRGKSQTVLRLQRNLRRLHVYRLMRDAILGTLIDREADLGKLGPRVPPELYRENLASMIELIRSHGGEPVFFAPTSRNEHQQRGPTIMLASPISVYRSVMASVAHDAAVAYVDVPLLSGRSRASATRFVDWCHPDAEGLCILARALAPGVRAAVGRTRSGSSGRAITGSGHATAATDSRARRPSR